MHHERTRSIGMDLKVLRVRAGLRQYRVAQELGIPPSTLCDWENGRLPVPPAQAARIVEAIRRLSGGALPGVGDGVPA